MKLSTGDGIVTMVEDKKVLTKIHMTDSHKPLIGKSLELLVSTRYGTLLWLPGCSKLEIPSINLFLLLVGDIDCLNVSSLLSLCLSNQIVYRITREVGASESIVADPISNYQPPPHHAYSTIHCHPKIVYRITREVGASESIVADPISNY